MLSIPEGAECGWDPGGGPDGPSWIRGEGIPVEESLLIFAVALGFVFAFINGFQDGGNVIGASVLSRSLSPHMALILACVAEVLGALMLGTAVATTIGKEVMNLAYLDPERRMVTTLFLLSGLLSAITWNLMTWWVGMPTSSSHALIGGLLGGGIAACGLGIVNWFSLFIMIGLPLLVAPAAGLFFGYLTMALFVLLFRGVRSRANRVFKRGQFISVLLLGASHGTNSAQKAMAVITMLLLGSGILKAFQVPLWVLVGCALSLVLGVFTGGWKIVRIRDNRIFKIEAVHSFAAQTAAGGVILAASLLGSPVGTMHIVKSSILGVGAGSRDKRPRKMVVKDFIAAWVITTPASAFLAAAIYWTASGTLGQGMGIFEGIMRMLGQ